LAPVSALLHELGHVLFYRFQGIPAGMSLVMEFPFINISARQYGIGSLGGPLVNVVMIIGANLLTTQYEKKSNPWTIFSALLVVNSFYLIFRVFLGLAKNNFGEIEYAMNVVGLHVGFAAIFFLLLAILSLSAWIKNSKINFSIRNTSYYLLIFISYLVVMFALEQIDSKYFWGKYPTITIEDVRVHNPQTGRK